MVSGARRGRGRWLACVVGAALGAQAPTPVPPRALLPDDVLAVVESGDLGAAVGGLIDALGAVPDDLPSTVRTEVGLGLTAIRAALGEAPSVLGRQLAAGGMALGVRLGADGAPEALLVLRPGDAKAARAFLAKAGERLRVVERDGWLLAGSSGPARDALLARCSQPNGRWADWPDAAAATAAPLRAYLDLARLRALGGQRGLDAVDGGGRWLLAPLVPALLGADRALLTLHGAGGLELTLRLSAPAGTAGAAAAAAPSPWRDLVPAHGAARTIVAPPDDALLTVALDRGLRALLADPGRYLPPASAAQALAFLGVADQLDGPRSSFVQDLLGGLAEPLTLYVLPPAAPVDADAPRLLLPSVALLAPIADARAEAVLQRTAQVLVVIGNTERAQRHQPSYRVRPLRDADGVHGLTAALPEWRGAEPPPTEHGIEPTLLFGHGHAVLASTQAAARALLQQAARGARAPVAGDRVTLLGPPCAAAVDRNRGPLVLARMLDEGERPADAERFWATAAGLLRALAAVELQATATDSGAAVTLRAVRR